MANTRLGLFGVGVDGYPAFEPKNAGHNPGVITRLTALGIGGARYRPFVAKSAALPAQDGFVGFPNIVVPLIEGVGYGILSDVWGAGEGVVGVAGRGAAVLSSIGGAGVGEHESWPTDDDLMIMLLAA